MSSSKWFYKVFHKLSAYTTAPRKNLKFDKAFKNYFINVWCMSSWVDLLMCQNFIYHDFFVCLLFTEKKRVWLVNGFFVGPIGDLVSRLKKQQRKYSYFKIQNVFKLENHWMIWYAYQWHKCIINPKFKCYPLIADFKNNYKNNIMLALTLIGILKLWKK